MPNATNDFLPKGYEIPKTSAYMKLLTGVNRFRVLSPAITGMEYWTTKEDGKRTPNRVRMEKDPKYNPAKDVVKTASLEISPLTGKLDYPQHFWAMVVWNYADKQIQVLELKQKTVLEAIEGYNKNTKWGSPTEYDITISKTGQGKETKYLTDHDPKEPIEKEISKQYVEMGINLEALFDGKDPFKKEDSEELPPLNGNPDDFIKDLEEANKA